MNDPRFTTPAFTEVPKTLCGAVGMLNEVRKLCFAFATDSTSKDRLAIPAMTETPKSLRFAVDMLFEARKLCRALSTEISPSMLGARLALVAEPPAPASSSAPNVVQQSENHSSVEALTRAYESATDTKEKARIAAKIAAFMEKQRRAPRIRCEDLEARLGLATDPDAKRAIATDLLEAQLACFNRR
jgi:hypothetical protein